MSTIRTLITRIVVSSVALALGSIPIAPLALADMTPPDANGNSCFIVGSDQPGNNKPAGSDANLFTYNCSTNLWQSSHYTFSPITDTRSPIVPPVYTYNATTGKYDTQTWDYSAALNDYVLTNHSVTTPPAGADVVGGPPPPSSTITNTGDGSNNTITNNGTSGGTQSIDGTGNNSDNSIDNNGTNNTTDNNGTTATVDNTDIGQATTGNAEVLADTEGGDATTGNALDEATVVNLLQSSSNALSGNTVTFVANINGDVNGDLLLDPASLSNVQPASDPGDTNLTVDNSTGEAINNDINLNADSGNATVADNTTAGSATSGSAEAIANVVNLIDSAITSGQSFVGTININGDLNGDILIPADFVNQLVADNVPTVTISTTGANSNNSVTDNGGQTTTVDNTNNQGINNNVTSGAVSGNADVSGNTTAGSATTGSAATNLTAFNLTGSNVVGSNDLLVFVNVIGGSWVGMIINAPAGATAAELGGGITSDTTNGSGTTDVTNTTNQQINNNINVGAQSGNADVKDNTEAGDATSGDAGTAVNLLNVQNSSLSLSGWFGILFINVFGTWNGNFGIAPVDTSSVPSAGNTGSIGGTGIGGTGGGSGPIKVPQVFSFVPTGGDNFNVTPLGASSTTISNTGANSTNAVLAAHIKANSAPTPALTPGHINWWLASSGVSAFFVYLVAERYYTIRRNTTKA